MTETRKQRTRRYLRAVCGFYGITAAEILSPARHAHIVEARQMAMYILTHKLKYTRMQTAKILKREHSTVTHGVKVATRRVLRSGHDLADIYSLAEQYKEKK